MKHFIFFITLFFCLVSFKASLIANPGSMNRLNSEADRDQTQINYTNKTQKMRTGLQNNALKTSTLTQTIPIQFHVIVENEGDEDLTEAEIAEELDDLNNLFDQVGFVFESCNPINYIPDSDYTNDIHPTLDVETDGSISNEELEIVNDHKVENVINVFYVNAIEGADALGGLTGMPGEDRDWILLATSTPNFEYPAYSEAVLAHQMGHYFNLFDTFRGTAQGVINEAVARENDGSNSPVNCGQSGVGDELCDTPADPEYIDFFSNGVLFPHNIQVCVSKLDCSIKELNEKLISFGCSVITDFNGDLYMPDYANIMSNSLTDCLNYFSPGQIDRMRTSLISDRSELLTNPCDDCPKIANLSGFHIQNSFSIFTVSEDIFSTATVKGENLSPGASPANAVYSAGESICLNPNFEAEYGSIFLAYIEGCTLPTPPVLPFNGKSTKDTLPNNLIIQPNPFSSQTDFVFQIFEDAKVSISISDIIGNEITVLMHNEQKKAGKYRVGFDGSTLPTGIYYCSVQVGNQVETQKMVITK